MSKVMIKYKHDEETFSCMGILVENKLMFINNGDRLEVTMLPDEIKITKKGRLGMISMNFKMNEVRIANYDVKDMGQVPLNIKTDILIVRPKKIFISYEIVESGDKHKYELEYEVI